jgi:hypothetical protein
MKQKHLDPAYLASSKSAIEAIASVDVDYPNLKKKNIRTYINAIVDRQVSAGGIPMSVVVVTDIESHRKKEVEGMLKKMQFKTPTYVQVRWDDQSDYLEAIFQVGKNPGKDVSE